MEFAPSNLNISKLKRKMDIGGLTVLIAAENVHRKGRFYMLWRDSNFMIIQAEPWWRPGVVSPDILLSQHYFLEEYRALIHLQEVIQTMLDTILFDGENNWAHLVRLKDNSYRLVYRKRLLIRNCQIWTKVVEVDDIELTRFTSGAYWEGTYEGKDVDIFIGWQDDWGNYISAESRGTMLVQSMGVGHYFFDIKAHVSKNGVIIGIMKEALVGRCVTPADRCAVFEAVTDILRHGVFFFFQICDIFITDRGVRFAHASAAEYYRDRDALAEEAECVWDTLADIFDNMEHNPLRGVLAGPRSMGSSAYIIPSLPSPCRPMALAPNEAIIRWIWSITASDKFCIFQGCAFVELYELYGAVEHSATRRGKRSKDDDRALLPPDDSPGEFEVSAARVRSTDKPLVVKRPQISNASRHHPYTRPTSKRLLLPRENLI